MGTTYKGNSPTYRSIGENILPTAANYPYHDGRFGVNSPSTGTYTRNIASSDPIGTATDFYDRIAYGGIENTYDGGTRKITQMADGTIVTWRKISSSDGTPVVEINIRNSSNSSGIRRQKIHFVED
jgi:hypothetical protein